MARLRCVLVNVFEPVGRCRHVLLAVVRAHIIHHIILELRDLESLSEEVEAYVMLEGLVVGRAAELAAVDPAREKAHDSLADVGKCE